jgi:hypothetical protein
MFRKERRSKDRRPIQPDGKRDNKVEPASQGSRNENLSSEQPTIREPNIHN